MTCENCGRIEYEMLRFTPSRCPGCRKTIEDHETKTICKGKTWHDVCAPKN